MSAIWHVPVTSQNVSIVRKVMCSEFPKFTERTYHERDATSSRLSSLSQHSLRSAGSGIPCTYCSTYLNKCNWKVSKNHIHSYHGGNCKLMRKDFEMTVFCHFKRPNCLCFTSSIRTAFTNPFGRSLSPSTWMYKALWNWKTFYLLWFFISLF